MSPRSRPDTDEAPPDPLSLRLEALNGRVTELVEITRGLAVNHVLYDGVRILDAQGLTTVDFKVPMAHIALYAHRTASTVLAAAAPPPVPTNGVGVVAVPPGCFVSVPMAGITVTLSGGAGDQLWLGAWSRPQPPSAAVVPIPVVTEAVPGVSGLITSVAPATYRGFSLRNTAGAGDAVVRIRDGSATGTILDTVQMIPGESARETYPAGIVATGGIYFELVSGTVEGSIRHTGS